MRHIRFLILKRLRQPLQSLKCRQSGAVIYVGTSKGCEIDELPRRKLRLCHCLMYFMYAHDFILIYI